MEGRTRERRGTDIICFPNASRSAATQSELADDPAPCIDPWSKLIRGMSTLLTMLSGDTDFALWGGHLWLGISRLTRTA